MFLLNLIVFLLLKKSYCFNEIPKIEELFTSPTLTEGKQFIITCQVNNGPVEFEWLLNDQKLISDDNIVITNHEDNSMLSIKKMNLKYSGEYSCQVSNSLSNSDRKTISVKLNGGFYCLKYSFSNEKLVD